MSDTKRRIPLAEAEDLADELLTLLRPACERIEVAGSIRRKKPAVGDIELVMIPKVELRPIGFNLFGEPTDHQRVNEVDQLCALMIEQGILERRLDRNGRPSWGERAKLARYRGVGLDLFSCLPPAHFGVLFLIRTGSWLFSKRFVTGVYDVVPETGERGWCPSGMKFRDGVLWRNGIPIDCREEGDVFAAVGKPFVMPEQREAAHA